MRTPLTVATGVVLVAGIVVGVIVSQSSTAETVPIQPIRVQAPAAADPSEGALVPELPADPTVQEAPPREPVPLEAAPQEVAPQEAAPQEAPQPAPRQDPNGYVAPPPADDDDDDFDADDFNDDHDDDRNDDADDD